MWRAPHPWGLGAAGAPVGLQQEDKLPWLGPTVFIISSLGPGPGRGAWEDSACMGALTLCLGTTIPVCPHSLHPLQGWGPGLLQLPLPDTQHGAWHGTGASTAKEQMP